MIRWSYVIPRFAVVVVLILAIGWLLGPLAKWATIKSLQASIGAKVDIESAHVGLLPPRIAYRNLRIADPREGKEMRNALIAESIEVEIDGDALMQRRWVARNAVIHGLEIGTERSETGHLPTEVEDPMSPSDLPSKLSPLAKNFLNHVASVAADKTEAVVNDLETVRRSRQLKIKWHDEFQLLSKRARSIESQVKDLKRTAGDINNPLRDFQLIGQTISKGDQTRAEIQTILQTLKSLPGEFQEDLESLERAKQTDLKLVDQYIPGDLSQSKNFGIDLVQDAIKQHVQTIKQYWQGGKQIATLTVNATVKAPEAQRERGRTVDLRGVGPEPALLIRTCQIDGFMSADGQRYQLTGNVENLSSDPSLVMSPLHTRFRLHKEDDPESNSVINVDYVMDQYQDRDSDRLTIHWPQSTPTPLKFGDKESLAIIADGGEREIWVQLRSNGDEVHGRLVSKQTNVSVQIQTAPKHESLAAVQAFQESLANLDVITIDAGFSGRWDDLDITVNTNLTDAIREATDQAIAMQIDATKAEMRSKINAAYEQQQADLISYFEKQQEQAQELAGKVDQLFLELASKITKGTQNEKSNLNRMRSLLNGTLQ